MKLSTTLITVAANFTSALAAPAPADAGAAITFPLIAGFPCPTFGKYTCDSPNNKQILVCAGNLKWALNNKCGGRCIYIDGNPFCV